jgi:hypothetical protein
MARTYWLDLFTVETWKEFRAHGANVSGFSEGRWSTVQKIKPGDYLLCYLVGLSRWVGVLEVTGPAFVDDTPIWSSKTYPSRLPVQILEAVDPEFGIPVLEMRDELSVFQNLSNPNIWSGAFRGSPARWKAQDGEAVVQVVTQAATNPVERPIGKVRQRSAVISASLSTITLDGNEDVEAAVQEETSERSETVHTEIQGLLLRLGSDLGFKVHVARTDQSKEWRGQRLSELPSSRSTLPNQFDAQTNRTIKDIDVLWLDGDAIVAAFEVESTTAIYSGLLRMSDLLARQPNVSIPLFLVAPDDRRRKVIKEVNRPTFARMNPPLAEICRYISFDGLRESIDGARSYIRYLKPDWLQEISEPCVQLDDDAVS